ncbi:MAG: protoporphyrinogen oxidase [Chlorobi bacterium]|nr:protoporphyrinogen oxidase [Chlorobiota bacterium]
MRVAIIGAGLTGLTVAYYLKKAGVKFDVFENTEHTGGVIRTKSKNGFVYETGPNTGTVSNVETVKLFEELSGSFEPELADERAAKRLILKNNKWVALPSGLTSGITTNLFTLKDKLRLLGEPFRKPGTNPDETIAALVRRRMGTSFLDYAVNPFISGIYAGDPEKLITKFALPKLYRLEQDYGSFIGGAIKKSKEPKTETEKKVSKKIFSAEGGLSELTNALAENTGYDNIHTGKNVIITRQDNHYKIENSSYTHVVTTVNGGALNGLLPFIGTKELKPVTTMRYAKVVEVSLGFNKWNGMDLNAFGGLIPAMENKNILGILFMSTLFKGRAPEGGALLTVFAGGIKKPELATLPETELIKLIKPELTHLLQLNNFNPDLMEISYHNNAIAQYEAGSQKRTETIKAIENKYNNLFLAGSIRDGVGMADRIKQATRLAETIISMR